MMSEEKRDRMENYAVIWVLKQRKQISKKSRDNLKLNSQRHLSSIVNVSSKTDLELKISIISWIFYYIFAEICLALDRWR